MSKGEGRRIAVRFNLPLVGDVTGHVPLPIGGYEYRRIDTLNGCTVTSLNQYSSSYDAIKTIDNSILSYWHGITSINWLKYEFATPFALTKLRIYLGDTYYLKTFTISGSNDGINWAQIGDVLNAASSSTRKWYEYELTNEVQYYFYKIDTLTANSSWIYVFEVEFYYTSPVGNEKFFSVSGLEYDYVPGGKTSNVVYKVYSVSPYQGIQKLINLSDSTITDLVLSKNTLILEEGG